MRHPQAFVFDLDGTVYLSDTPIPGVPEAIQQLRMHGVPVLFLSNNPTKTPVEYVKKLTSMGIPVTTHDVLTSAIVMVDWLQQQSAPRVYPIAEPALITLLKAAGIAMTAIPAEIDYVLASFDRTFTYAKLQIAFDAMRSGAKLIATNPDKYCPVPGGGQPDAAAIIAAIEASTDTRLAFTAGKPSQLAAQAAAQRLGIAIEHIMMIGDRLETDIGMGHTGMQTGLVMTGATTPQLLTTWQGHQPDIVAEDVVSLLAQLSV
ncbi:MAG: HAD-IIA family hydrolase [Roseiflexaceae bacterium]